MLWSAYFIRYWSISIFYDWFLFDNYQTVNKILQCSRVINKSKPRQSWSIKLPDAFLNFLFQIITNVLFVQLHNLDYLLCINIAKISMIYMAILIKSIYLSILTVSIIFLIFTGLLIPHIFPFLNCRNTIFHPFRLGFALQKMIEKLIHPDG